MSPSEGTFRGSGEISLFYRRWHTCRRPRGAVALCHGFGEHGARYAAVAERLAERGFSVYALDHRGHGRSPGPRGHVDRWDRYREDLAAFLSLIEAEEPAVPRVLFGHSMGALIVLDFALRRPEGLCGVVSSGAGLEPVGVARPHLVALARLLTRIAPRVSVPLPLDAAMLSRDPAVVKAYRADPLVFDRATVRWGTESLAAVRWIKAHAPELEIPILLVHGGADPVASPEGSRDFFEAVPHAEKELRIYPNALHEPHNGWVRERVLEELARWLDARCGESDCA